MRVSIISFYSKPVKIFHYIHFYSQVGSITKIHRFIIGILSFVQQSVFNRILQSLVEHTYHELLRGFREEFITQIEVIGYRMFQIRISFFLIIFIDNAVRYNLKEAGTVDGTGIRETQVRVFMYSVFCMEARQYIRIFLVSFRICILCRELQCITLIGMFHTNACNKFPFLVCVFHHSISCTNLFSGIIV